MRSLRTRTTARSLAALIVLSAFVVGCGSDDATDDATDEASGGSVALEDCRPTAPIEDLEGEAAEIVEVASGARDELALQAVLLRVERGGEEVVTAALGESLPAVPAETDMRFRNGAVAYSYLGTLLLLLVEDGVVGLDDPISTWFPDAPAGEQITLEMLASSTSGYVDFVPMDEFVDELYADPFHAFSLEELQAFVFDQPLAFEPGTSWTYSHLNFHLLGRALEEAAGTPLAALLAERIVDPLGLRHTESIDTAALPDPALRTFTDERGRYEESSSWSPAWGVPAGAVMLTDVCDLARSARGVGTGELLTEAAFELFLDPGTIGLEGPTDACPRCIQWTEERHYGLGIVTLGDWVVQTPLFTGTAAVQAYLPAEDLAIGIANTFAPGSDIDVNGSMAILGELIPLLAPDSPLPDR